MPHPLIHGCFLDDQRLQREAAAGFWPERMLTDYLDANLQRSPDATAIISHVSASDQIITLSFAELANYAARIAGNLRALGIGPGDVVSFQLPNWWQFAAIHLACVRIGAISNPLMPIFRERELRFMLGFAESKALIAPKTFRGFDHATLALKLHAELPQLEHLFIVGGDGETSFEQQLLNENTQPVTSGSALTPNDVMQLLYTSGTTGEPKGVLHTSNTLLCIAKIFYEGLQLGADDVLFMPSPLAHQTGFTYGVCIGTMLGAPLLLMDVWQPAKAAALMEQYGACYTFAATPFLADLTHLPEIKRFNLEKFRIFVTAGAPIPPSLVDAARENLGANIVSGWGMTECGFATGTYFNQQRVTDSDGAASPGQQVRVVDLEGHELPPDQEGNLQFRGSALFAGYLKRPQLYDVDKDGWLNTGDIARMDADGYIRIIGRSKDIIIRGGENIPVIEVENLIHQLEQIADVAIVAMPDQRLGEKACAFVTLHSGQTLTFQQLCNFLLSHNLAKQYLPERLEIINEMPRTPSGKIQKFILRERARAFAG
jgi:cyclohexanecarboxylate-CoA ligase